MLAAKFPVGDLLREEGFSLQGNAKNHRAHAASGPGRRVEVALVALAVELGGEAIRSAADASRFDR